MCIQLVLLESRKTHQANIDKVLQELNEVAFEKRKARFYCALAVAFPEGDKKPVIVNGTCEGFILEQRRGENGFDTIQSLCGRI